MAEMKSVIRIDDSSQMSEKLKEYCEGLNRAMQAAKYFQREGLSIPWVPIFYAGSAFKGGYHPEHMQARLETRSMNSNIPADRD